MHNESMPNVLIRDLPTEVHAALVAHADDEGQSLQQYLTAELTKLSSRPTSAELFRRIRLRGDRPDVAAADIVTAIRAERDSS